MENATIAIVEDDDAMREALSALIRSTGARPATFATMGDFLDGPTLSELTCVLVDVQLRDGASFGLHAALVERGVALPMVFISAEPAWAAHAARIGAQFLCKPFSADQVLELLGTWDGHAERPRHQAVTSGKPQRSARWNRS